jgi:hypothetical protein
MLDTAVTWSGDAGAYVTRPTHAITTIEERKMNLLHDPVRHPPTMLRNVLRRACTVAGALVLAHAALNQDAIAGTARGKIAAIYIINGSAPSAAGANVLGFTIGGGSGTVGAPPCSDGSFAIDLGSPVGRAMHQQLMHAVQQSAIVYVQGDDTCGVWNQGRERVLSIQVNYNEYWDSEAKGTR